MKISQEQTKTLNKTSNANRRAQTQHTNKGKHTTLVLVDTLPNWSNTFVIKMCAKLKNALQT